jgi:DNA-directed RNA polymerase specialized sigma subunit
MLVYQHSKDLEDTLGREPTREELMHAARIPKARIDKILRLAHARIPSSVYEDAQDDDDEGKDLVSESDPDMVWREAVYHGLGDVDKYIFEHKLGYEGAKILDTNHMAMKLRMSPSAISQRAARIQQQLDRAHVGY